MVRIYRLAVDSDQFFTTVCGTLALCCCYVQYLCCGNLSLGFYLLTESIAVSAKKRSFI